MFNVITSEILLLPCKATYKQVLGIRMWVSLGINYFATTSALSEEKKGHIWFRASPSAIRASSFFFFPRLYVTFHGSLYQVRSSYKVKKKNHGKQAKIQSVPHFQES